MVRFYSRCVFLFVAILWSFSAPLQALSCKVVVYNLNNYLLKPRGETFAKSTASLMAINVMLSKLQPDILAVSEMGTREDLAYLQIQLKKAGYHLPYTVWLDAPDPVRHLALLSRFPIERNQSRLFVPTRHLSGHLVKRGILDVTLRLEEGEPLRIVSCHLKSQKPSANNLDSQEIRLAEAQALAAHIQKILKFSPHANLLVCGDFNDHPTSPTLKVISARLYDFAPTDARGEQWTHYFAREKAYSRYDYLFASSSLVPKITKTGIGYIPQWRLASDHRPLYFSISTPSLR